MSIAEIALRRSVQLEGTATLMDLPQGTSRERAIEIIECRQLLVSRDGDIAAALRSHGDGHVIVHSRMGILPTAVSGETRILCVTPFRTTCWGTLENTWTGTFQLSEQGVRPLQPLDSLKTLHEAPYGLMPRGTVIGDPDDIERLVLKDQSLEVSRDSEWTVMRDGSIIIMQPLNGPHFRYRIRRSEENGVESVWPVDFSPPLPFEATSVRALRLLSRYMYVVERGRDTTLLWVEGVEIPIDGVVECSWNSPTATAAVLLIRSNRNENSRGAHRRLVLLKPHPLRVTTLGQSPAWVKQETIFSGRFEMDYHDLWWSKSGNKFVAQITEFREKLFDEVDPVTCLVSSTQDVVDIPEGVRVRDPVVDNSGLIAGYILATKEQHIPFAYGVAQPAVPYAWNMTFISHRRLSYNTLHDSAIEQQWVYAV